MATLHQSRELADRHTIYVKDSAESIFKQGHHQWEATGRNGRSRTGECQCFNT
ncbi:hypothetical protein QUA43_16560 [Microcoleus sp. N9_B4]|uniref:hypothetical protein n=1 Tax=Microcoleus sp. N9_B4 TaxID=3055386 RepID=UPI002FD33E35